MFNDSSRRPFSSAHATIMGAFHYLIFDDNPTVKEQNIFVTENISNSNLLYFAFQVKNN